MFEKLLKYFYLQYYLSITLIYRRANVSEN